MQSRVLSIALMTAVVLCTVALSAQAQEAPANLDFELPAAPGAALPRPWIRGEKQAHYEVILDSTQAFAGRHSLTIRSHGTPPDDEFGNVLQSFDATPYRGKQVLFRATVRLSTQDQGEAHLWLRVDRPEKREGFFSTKTSREIRSPQWEKYQMLGYVAPDAERIVLGCFLAGEGEAGFDDLEFTALNGGALASDNLPEILTIETAVGSTTRLPLADIWSVTLFPAEMIILLNGGKGQLRAIGDYSWFAKPFLAR